MAFTGTYYAPANSGSPSAGRAERAPKMAPPSNSRNRMAGPGRPSVVVQNRVMRPAQTPTIFDLNRAEAQLEQQEILLHGIGSGQLATQLEPFLLNRNALLRGRLHSRRFDPDGDGDDDRFFFHRRRFGTGCFFNGFSDLCFGGGFFGGGFVPFGFWPYGYGYGYDSYAMNDSSAMAYNETGNPDVGPYASEAPMGPPPADAASAQPAPLAVIVLRDGTQYEVSDYWISGGKFFYITSYGGENSIPLEQLDWQRTVDANAARGVEFTLRPTP